MTPATAAATPVQARRGSRSRSSVTASVTVTIVKSDPRTETTVVAPHRALEHAHLALALGPQARVAPDLKRPQLALQLAPRLVALA